MATFNEREFILATVRADENGECPDRPIEQAAKDQCSKGILNKYLSELPDSEGGVLPSENNSKFQPAN